ncbi:undecaprenyl-phosphate glucose phosphotransferase [Pseudoalteromonas gelatinilytica]|uniref:Undecaprenyl-phosphate glucose phosphotransferase n=1 Tax=Pseudoalteromonas gelatinilytica TaxID=1703256 RepID=A0ABQ1TRI5_9GAMM|nr:undecaprenyl-phosphate glucose phosphotransferase [Pseudoalteromonas profundi]GGF00374.1 undecaprenyl-phosphate glucose phosphotransferase [Pseudoalteromonas profundi]
MSKGFAKENHVLVALMHRCSDLFAILFGFAVSMWLINGDIWPQKSFILTLFLSFAIAFWLYPYLGMYRTWRGESKLKEVGLATYCWTINQLILGAIYYISDNSINYDNTLFIYWYLIGLVALVVIRFTIRVLLNKYRSKGGNQRHVVVIGDGNIANRMVAKVYNSPWTGYKIVGSFGDEPLTDCNLLGDFNDIENYINEHCEEIDQIWIALPLSDELLVEQILHGLRNATQTIRYIPDMRGFRLINHSVSDIAGMPVINLSMSPISGSNQLLKSLEDKFLSGIILLMISPILIALAIGVKLTSPGPVFYRQERVSWNNKKFMMLKFRSMPQNSEKDGVQWGGAKNKTNTKFGQFIRKTSLDELPQFINVLKGDMSIVGPRPERTVFVEQFKDEIPGYMQKHMVKAGITGWAQINGWRGDTDLQKRIDCDLYYIDNWSVWFDIKIIFLTIFKGFVNKNAY